MELKIAFLIIVISVSNVFATPTYSQIAKVSLNMENKSLEQVMDEIEIKSEFYFIFNQKQIDVSRIVNIQEDNKLITDILPELFKGTNVNYVVLDRKILLTTDPLENNLLAISSGTEPQQNRITGTVTDKDGTPLPGVNVVITGTTLGAMTDIDGKYSIEVPQGARSLTFSFVGMVSQEITIGTLTQINVTMAESAIGLEEVVVIGYGTQQKIAITSSISSTTKESLVAATPTNITNALAGRLPGLIVVQGNGDPGSSPLISIRGASTFGDNSVLIVIDGIVRDNELQNLDPNEIESLSILKDAAATVVYGSRAANGVILVTTKRGSLGKPKFSYSEFVGMQQPTLYPKMMNAYQFATIANAGYANDGLPPEFTDQQIADFKSGKDPGVNYFDLTFKNQSFQTSHNLNVNGGSEYVKYFASISYLYQGGMIAANNFKRYSLRSNVDAKINSTLTVSTDIEANFHQKNDAEWSAASLFFDCMWSSPTIPYLNPDGSVNYHAQYAPLWSKTGYQRNATNVLQATLSFNQELPFIKGLNLAGKVTFGREFNNSKNYSPPAYVYFDSYEGTKIGFGGYNGKTAVSANLNEYFTNQYSLNLNYKRTFGDHEVSGIALFEQFGAKGDNVYGFRTNFPAEGLDELLFGGQLQKDSNGGSFTDGRQSFVMRGNYDYKKRYLFEASLRIDGSVAFPTSKKWGYFPSFSAGWRVSEESFIKNNPNLSFIDQFKVRASYGIAGSDRNVYNGRVPTFQYMQAYNYGDTFISGGNPVLTLTPGVLPNLSITWESAAISNIGFDGSFWKGKFEFDIDLFYKRTSDILGTRIRSVPATLGASLPAENYAVMDNKGIEMSFTHNNQFGKLKFYVRANGSFSRNKVITLDEPANIPDYLRQTGRPLGFRVGYVAIGFFQSDDEVASSIPEFNGGQKAGSVKYADINGPNNDGLPDGKVDENDRSIISMNNNTPKIMGGLAFGGSYGGFDFDVLFQGATKVNMWLQAFARQFQIVQHVNNFVDMLDYWTPENLNPKYPAPRASGAYLNDARDSKLYLRDASYVRLKSVNIGYTLPESLLNKIHIEKLRVYVSGTNLLVWNKKLMFDPEAESGDGGYYPQQRTVNLGLNLTF